VFNQSQGQGWGRGGGVVAGQPAMREHRGYKGAFPHPSWDGNEGGEEAIDMPYTLTYVTLEHLFFVKRTLTYLALGILGGEAAMGVGEGWYGPCERG